MSESRKEYKWVRLITGGFMPAVLTLAVLVTTVLNNGGWKPGGRLAGICKELVLGSTEGRQALAGSCWNGPLGALFYLPAAWVVSADAAGYMAFFGAFFLMLWSVREALKSSSHALTHILSAQLGICVLALTVIPPAMLNVNTVLPVALFTIAFGSLLDWSEKMRLRDIVMTGAGVAMLSISGVHFFALGVWLALAIPLIWFWHRKGEHFARTTSAALIGWMPVIYCFGTWVLLNWLIMGDPAFFVRSLVRYTRESGYPFLITILAPGVVIIGYLKLGIIFCRGNAKKVASSAGNRIFSLLIVISALGYLCGLRYIGLEWCASEILLSVLMLVLIFCVRFFDNRALVIGSSILFVVVVIWLGSVFVPYSPKSLSDEQRVNLRREVEDYVAERTKNARVFVPGYAGLSLLQDYRGEILVPNLHFHVNTLRQDYFGQELYVLVAKPEGFAAMEYIFNAYPGIYKYGCERLLFADKFGDWHLFQVVSAPTWRELNAAKQQL